MIVYTWSILDIFGDETVNKVCYLLKTKAQAVIDTKASALAKLAKLGLTAEEIKALL